ncbi:uncharacterized protein LOC118612895 isoform X2 [Rousettus aegyptiacus]|uniref:uncharacterized protein LOC118612895 isoform X2 n=1 Tax=Rousettus aegyptiacus TaxID=9407 RepID=UPI00168CD53B|nr:uncharacterized protein LOC118612895 isoform X2 [Rousettus aegyptiacus]
MRFQGAREPRNTEGEYRERLPLGEMGEGSKVPEYPPLPLSKFNQLKARVLPTRETDKGVKLHIRTRLQTEGIPRQSEPRRGPPSFTHKLLHLQDARSHPGISFQEPQRGPRAWLLSSKLFSDSDLNLAKWCPLRRPFSPQFLHSSHLAPIFNKECSSPLPFFGNSKSRKEKRALKQRCAHLPAPPR